MKRKFHFGAVTLVGGKTGRLILSLFLALGGSEIAAQSLPDRGGTPPAPLVTVTNLASNMPPVSLAGYVPDDRYKLRVGDRVSLQILEDRDLPRSLTVADSGELEVPYLGRVAAADKTCKQLAAELKGQLEKEYYYRATVIIALDAANRVLGRVYILGQVRTQGPIEIAINENLTVGKAILRAGGFGDFANKKHVKLIHSTAASGQNVELNMVEILEQGKVEKDIILKPDDFIIVPSRLINL